MTDAWDERTEAIPGTKADKSFELDFDFGDSSEVPATALGLSVVVFEPSPFGLSDALTRMGLSVRVGKTGVDVMSVVATDAPGAVVCAPAPDPERRRLLAAALRLRFPHVPIIYVSTHAGQEDAVLGALREGARAVLAWPLPASAEVLRVLGPYLKKAAAGHVDRKAPARNNALLDTAPTPKPPPAASAERSGADVTVHDDVREAQVAPAPELHDEPTGISRGPGSQEYSSFDAIATVVTADEPAPVLLPERPTASAARVARPTDFMADEPSTQPNMRPAAVAVVEALSERRGEIGELLAAVSPFLWSLEDASRWAAELGARGDLTAANHARTLMLLAKILGQLQARIDEAGA